MILHIMNILNENKFIKLFMKKTKRKMVVIIRSVSYAILLTIHTNV